MGCKSLSIRCAVNLELGLAVAAWRGVTVDHKRSTN
jgi:hypothetical protein